MEIAHAAHEERLKGMYIMGENPFISDPNVSHVRDAFLKLDFLVVQDIFLTETAEAADVVLPATTYFEKTGTYTNTDRRVQLGKTTLEPPGEARLDWQILCDVMTRMGYPQAYDDIEQVFDEFVSLNDSYQGLTYAHLEGPGKLWPCPDPEHSDGEVVLFGDGFPTENGRGKFVPAEAAPPDELPDEEYPFILNTGRSLQHWHTGSMTRRTKVLDALRPEAACEIHPDDLARLGIAPEGFVRLTTRRGSVRVKAVASTDTAKGTVFIPFGYREAAGNLLTSDEVDPYGKIPAFKWSALKVEPALTGGSVASSPPPRTGPDVRAPPRAEGRATTTVRSVSSRRRARRTPGCSAGCSIPGRSARASRSSSSPSGPAVRSRWRDEGMRT